MLCIKNDRRNNEKKRWKISNWWTFYEIIEKELVHENNGAYGRHEVRTNTILLNDKIHPDRKKETLFMKCYTQYYSMVVRTPEHIIDCISNGLFQLGVGEHYGKA